VSVGFLFVNARLFVEPKLVAHGQTNHADFIDGPANRERGGRSPMPRTPMSGATGSTTRWHVTRIVSIGVASAQGCPGLVDRGQLPRW